MTDVAAVVDRIRPMYTGYAERSPLTFDDYWKFFVLTFAAHPEYRLGQTAMNILSLLRPDLVNPVHENPDTENVFFMDEQFPALYEFLTENW